MGQGQTGEVDMVPVSDLDGFGSLGPYQLGFLGHVSPERKEGHLWTMDPLQPAC